MATQWYRADDAQKTNPVGITGATKKQYNTQPNDNGKYVYRDVDGVQSNAIGPIAAYPVASIPNTRLAELDFENLAVGTYANYTDAQGNMWTPNGAATFPIVQEGTRKGLQLTGTGLLSLRNTNAAKWKNLHDGTIPYTIYFEGRIGSAADPNAVYGLLGTCAGTNSKTGVALLWDDRLSQKKNNTLTLQISNAGGLGSNAHLLSDALNAFAPNRISSFFAEYNPAGADNYTVRVARSKMHKASKQAYAASTATATHDMEIGACGNGPAPMVGLISRIIIFEGLVSESDKLKLEGARGAYLDLPAMEKLNKNAISDGRYNSFGTLIHISEDKAMYVTRSGTDHFLNGRCDLIDYNRNTKEWSNRRTLYTPSPTQDIRDPRGGVIGNRIIIFTVIVERDTNSPYYNGVIPNGRGYFLSTDLTGTSWSAFIPLNMVFTKYGCPWGKLQQLDATTYIQPYWKANDLVTGSTFTTGFLKSTDNGATWTENTTYSGTGHHATETTMLNCGGGKLLSISRLESYWGNLGGLGQMTSTDNGATWTAMTRTNLGGALANIPCLYFDAVTQTISLFYQDREDGWIKVSPKNSVAAIFASATGWKTPINYEYNDALPRATGHINPGLGYPDYDGTVAIWAKEDGDAIARLVFREDNLSSF